MSKLLLDDKPILVLPSLAKLIGLNESIILQQVHYLIQVSNNERDGYKWVYNTNEAWLEYFPFWSVSTIRRSIAKLENQELLIVGNYNKLKIDNTKWYRINYEKLEGLNRPPVQSEQTDGSEWADGQVNLNRPLPETSSKTSSNNSSTNELTNEDGESDGTLQPANEGDHSHVERKVSHTPEQFALALENRFIQLRGKGLQVSPKDINAIYEVANSGVSLEDALKWLEEVFANYKPNYPGKFISAFEYCKPIILEKYHLKQERLKVAEKAKRGDSHDQYAGSSVRPGKDASGISTETQRLEKIAREKGLVSGEIRDTDFDF